MGKAQDKNSLLNVAQREKSSRSQPSTVGRTDAQFARLSSARNVRTETAWPKPDFGIFKRSAVTTADADPSITKPSDGLCWDMEGYSGLHGYAIFTAGTLPSVDLELWAKDDANDAWFLVATRLGVSASQEFRFAELVRSRKVFLRVAAIDGAPTNVTVRVSPE